MPRIARCWQWTQAACYHLMDRGHNRQAVFLDDEDRAAFLGLVGRYRGRGPSGMRPSRDGWRKSTAARCAGAAGGRGRPRQTGRAFRLKVNNDASLRTVSPFSNAWQQEIDAIAREARRRRGHR